MVSVTSTLHFRDALHFTITTTTTTTMTTPTTKPPPPPPPRAQTRPPPLQEQTGLETQLRLESQVYFFSLFFFSFCELLTFIYSVYGMRATTTTTDGTQAHEDEKGPKRCQTWHRLGPFYRPAPSPGLNEG